MGGQGKSLHQRTNDERTTNERTNERRRQTTWTIIIPRQDSQNPRANKVNIFKIEQVMSMQNSNYFLSCVTVELQMIVTLIRLRSTVLEIFACEVATNRTYHSHG